MKAHEIEVGKTYTNRGAGKTARTVIAIGVEHRPSQFWNNTGIPPNPDEPGVLYEQNGAQRHLFLSSFAAWCGKEVTPNDYAADQRAGLLPDPKCNELERKTRSQQAKIDALMMEFCPDEMTQEQMEEWERSQKPVDS